jgi:hypothetical protein
MYSRRCLIQHGGYLLQYAFGLSQLFPQSKRQLLDLILQHSKALALKD